MALADLAALQTDALAAAPLALADGDVEESALYVDASGTLARAERHETALKAVASRVSIDLSRPVPYATTGDGAPLYAAYFAAAVDAMGLANISGAEIVAVHSRVTKSGVKNRLPGPWGLLRLLYVLPHDQRVRETAGAPLRETSINRDGPYNLAIGGVRNSAHRACIARDRVLVGHPARELHKIDLVLRGTRLVFTPQQPKVIATVRAAYGLGAPLNQSVYGEPFSGARLRIDGLGYTHDGGLGLYVASGFVHADARGTRANWTG